MCTGEGAGQAGSLEPGAMRRPLCVEIGAELTGLPLATIAEMARQYTFRNAHGAN